ncbi:MAG: HAMP domain-containing histidine kinase [Treponema sp.]|nr:HAMP domain-containing histidine kinase [Treponema sp.]
MTIRRQFNLLLASIIIVPLLCVSFIPLYVYFTSPERMLIHNYKSFKRTDMIQLSDNDWDILFKYVHRMPRNVEISLLALNETVNILISTMQGLNANTSIEYSQLLDIVATTQNRYFYQFGGPDFGENKQNLLILSRIKKTSRQSRRFGIIRYSIAILLSFATLIFIIIVRISHNIFSSITILEERAQKIADGDLSAPLINELQENNSNEIISLAENLEKMRMSLLDSQERRSNFIMGISHDLRTPIAVIKGYTEALSDNVITNPREITKSFEIINTKTNQLENMIDSLINFIKLDSTDWRQKFMPESVYDVVAEFGKSSVITGTVFNRKVTYNVDISPDIKIDMDKQLFLRALENLFSNAIRYSNEGDSVSISGAQTPTSCIISVSDTGIGIAQKEQAHIFDMFYRASSSRREEGMGIGLTIVKNIVDSHGWKIAVESELGKGTTFTIVMPRT